MDSELFTVGGKNDMDYTLYGKSSKIGTTDANGKKTATDGEVNYQKAKTYFAVRYCLKVLYWMMVIYVLYMAVYYGEMIYKWIAKDGKLSFTQKEGLQYLGASTSIVRDDMGWPTNDSLAEKAMKMQQETADTPTKATFVVPRERMDGARELTPEEKLLKDQQKS